MAIVVKAGPQDTNDQVIRKFKKKVMVDQILITLKEKEYFKKPSVKKQERLKELDRKRRRQESL